MAQAEEQLLDIRVAEASAAYKFYLNQEKKILGGTAVILFLLAWESMGNWLGLINPMFMSAPSLIGKAAWQMFSSGEIYNDLYVSGIEFFWGYVLSVVFAIPFGIAIVTLFAWSLHRAFRSVWGLGVIAVFLHAMVDYPFSRPALGCWAIVVLAMLAAPRDDTKVEAQILR